MLVRIDFDSTVGKGKEKKTQSDFIVLHRANTDGVKEMFEGWLDRSVAVRGHSGVFYTNDSIKFKKVSEYTNA